MLEYSNEIERLLIDHHITIKNIQEIPNFSYVFVRKWSPYFIEFDSEIKNIQKDYPIKIPGWIFTLSSGRRDGKRNVYYTLTSKEELTRILSMKVFW